LNKKLKKLQNCYNELNKKLNENTIKKNMYWTKLISIKLKDELKSNYQQNLKYELFKKLTFSIYEQNRIINKF
jgi:hypothetical protein